MSEEPLESAPPLPPERKPQPTWFDRFSSFLFVVFCCELGLFLLVYPWTDSWTENYFSVAAPDRVLTVWRLWWNNPYVRGAVSGLGVVNLWIALTEVFRMFGGRRRE